MTVDRWEHLKSVLQAAWELDAAERPAFLDGICGEDARLRADVEALLAADEKGGTFLATEDGSDGWPGREIGPYRIVREIGHGGMGLVYLAERADGQYQKQVAIKLVNPGTGDSFLRRFLRERQVLAGLDHPNVVRLLDGGAESGMPYIVLEYVDGVRIDTWCQAHRLAVRDCLRLFRSVCGAVEYAHGKGVIHLDIKPGNILVTAEGVPKLLDFGIARVLGGERLAETTGTAAGPRPMTPEYASPEQARGETVGPATDIYALGMVLCKLLTGRLPGPSAAGLELEGDLGSILRKALSPEPGARYASAAGLSEDLDRCLQDLPVRARRASLRYRAGKLVKRNRLVFSLAGAIFAATILVLAVSRPAALKKTAETRVPKVEAPVEATAPTSAPLAAVASIRSLVVVQIENQAKSPALERLEYALGDLLATNLANAGRVPIISTDRARELAGRRVQGGGTLSPDQVRDVAREAHADLFLAGVLTQAGARIRLEFRIQETQSGRTLFADRVEGNDVQAIFGIADRASARILERLAPGAAAPEPMRRGALTVNVEALKAYEEGIENRIRFRAVEARDALQRAIELDPQFVMAHYHLADAMRFNGQVPEARRSVARAVELARRGAVPRLQKMLADALQMRLDLRLEEAGRILEAAHREFPQETEPAYQLAVIRGACARFGEAAALLEEVIRVDGRHPLAHNQLGYQYAFLGNVGRATAAIDRYAALLPPKNEVPYCSRGDVYMINGRYEEALAQYREVNYTGPMAVAALHAGDYGMVDSLIQRRRQTSSQWSGTLGDLAAARGQLDSAAPLYEEAVHRYLSSGPLRPWFALLSAARIYLEQGRHEEVLELGRRNDHPWAGGFRGTAYLLLHRDAEAEKEFTALRDSITPLMGDYVAAKTVEFHRMLAASYSGRHDKVIEMWFRLPRSWWSLYALDVGRAYLNAGLFAEAEHHLGLARKVQQAYFMNGDTQAQHNLLTWMLAGFYLGQVMEKTGRLAGAREYYEDFAKHFENSAATLPQIAAARTLLGRLRFSGRGKLIFSDEFEGRRPAAGIGDWQISGTAADRNQAGVRAWKASRQTSYHDAIFEIAFRFDSAGQIELNLGDERDPVARLLLASDRIVLFGMEPGARRLGILDRVDRSFAPGNWHQAVVEVQGKKILAQIDDKAILTAESPALDIEKRGLSFFDVRAIAALGSVRMYEIAQR